MGVVVGYLPMLLLILIAPGMWASFWEDLRYVIPLAGMSMGLPIPGPWRSASSGGALYGGIRMTLMGAFFVMILVFSVSGAAYCLRQRMLGKPVSPLLAASSFVSLPYAHYAYLRADVLHLALGIFPTLIGILALLSRQRPRVKWVFATSLCAASVALMAPSNIGLTCRYLLSCADVVVGNEIGRAHV